MQDRRSFMQAILAAIPGLWWVKKAVMAGWARTVTTGTDYAVDYDPDPAWPPADSSGRYLIAPDDGLNRLIRWVPVEERLPECHVDFRYENSDCKNRKILVLFVSGGMLTVSRWFFSDGRSFWGSYVPERLITHWAELPTPPNNKEST